MPSRKGAPNRNKQFLLKRLKEMYGDDFDPIIRMAESAIKMQAIANLVEEDDNASLPDKFSAHKETQIAWGRVADWTEPKLKPIEVDPQDFDDDGYKPRVIKLVGVAPKALPNG